MYGNQCEEQKSVGELIMELKSKNWVKRTLKIIVGIAVVIVLVMIGIDKNSTIDLNKYLIIRTSGYNGYGTATASIDWDAIEEKYRSKLSFRRKASKKYSSDITPIEAIQDSVAIDLKNTSALSNGNIIEYTWNDDDNISEYVTMKIKHKNGRYTVTGLQEPELFDVFDYVTVSFNGISSFGQAKIEYTRNELESSDFIFNKQSQLKNGDKIVISLENGALEQCAQRYGRLPRTTSKEYIVSGLDEYAKSYSELTNDLIDGMQREAEDEVSAYMAQKYSYSLSHTTPEYAGYIMQIAIDSSTNPHNKLYIIYKAIISNQDTVLEKVYFPVVFTDIVIGREQKPYQIKSEIVGEFSIRDTPYTSKGYANPLQCYIDLTTKSTNDYIECGGEFEAYQAYEHIVKMSDISEQARIALFTDAKEQIRYSFAQNANMLKLLSDPKVIGEYLLVNKNQEANYTKINKYIIVYSSTVSINSDPSDTQVLYLPVEYNGIIKLPNGEVIFALCKGIQGNLKIDSLHEIKGYNDSIRMYSDLITANRDHYTYEVSEGLQQFGN